MRSQREAMAAVSGLHGQFVWPGMQLAMFVQPVDKAPMPAASVPGASPLLGRPGPNEQLRALAMPPAGRHTHPSAAAVQEEPGAAAGGARGSGAAGAYYARMFLNMRSRSDGGLCAADQGASAAMQLLRTALKPELCGTRLVVRSLAASGVACCMSSRLPAATPASPRPLAHSTPNPSRPCTRLQVPHVRPP